LLCSNNLDIHIEASSAIISLGSILFGYVSVYHLLQGLATADRPRCTSQDLGIIASVLPASDFLRVTGNPNETYLGFITSSLLLGAFCGCIPSSFIADKFSRKTASE
jgi:hypothetical protein